jgi:hypothetical protein
LNQLVLGANIRPINEAAVAELMDKFHKNRWKTSSQLVVCKIEDFDENQPLYSFISYYLDTGLLMDITDG